MLLFTECTNHRQSWFGYFEGSEFSINAGVAFKAFISCQYYLRSWFYFQQRRENLTPIAVIVTHSKFRSCILQRYSMLLFRVIISILNSLIRTSHQFDTGGVFLSTKRDISLFAPSV